MAQTIARFSGPARELAAALPAALQGHDHEVYERRVEELSAAGVAPELAHRAASMNPLLAVFDITEDADACGGSQPLATTIYFGIGSRLGLDWLRDRIFELPRSDRWQALARAALRDDLYELHRGLTRDVLTENEPRRALVIRRGGPRRRGRRDRGVAGAQRGPGRAGGGGAVRRARLREL